MRRYTVGLLSVVI
ncbi:MAG: hypothetical protein LBT25_00400 [Candidatus Symbiothrix sp.]|nr:hypothetical protein [Candidatus Symbiothrix sp.]